MKYLVLILALLSGLASAGEVGRLKGQGFGVVLYDDKGKCSEGREAVFISAEGATWGCWASVLGLVIVGWNDGEFTVRPKAEFGLKSI